MNPSLFRGHTREHVSTLRLGFIYSSRPTNGTKEGNNNLECWDLGPNTESNHGITAFVVRRKFLRGDAHVVVRLHEGFNARRLLRHV